MTKQLHIQTTPKYNFPLPIKIPQELLELSTQTLENHQSKRNLNLNSTLTNVVEKSIEKINNGYAIAGLNPIKVEPSSNETMVVALDVSSIKIGETMIGTVIAVRGTIVLCRKRRYYSATIGPLPFHITEENKHQILGILDANMRKQQFFKVTTAPDPSNLQTKMASILETWLKLTILTNIQESLILWDGSLTAGNSEISISFLRKMLEIARRNRNTILAFSKMTRLRFSSFHFNDLLIKYPSPCIIPIDDSLIDKNRLKLLGKIYLAKLNGTSVFRMDVDRNLSVDETLNAVCKLIGNDLIVNGYPETLRLAHVFSTFTANEVIGIQRFLNTCYGLKIINRPSVRRLLFGPFGKEHEN